MKKVHIAASTKNVVVKSAKKPLSKVIGRIKAAELINSNGGRIFSVTVNTSKTPNRVITGRLTAPSKTKTKSTVKAPNVKAIGMLRMYDMVEHGWKTINLQNLTGLRLGGTSYRVK